MSARRRSSYRRLLRWYPVRWRLTNGEVVLETLEEHAEASGRSRPTQGEAWSLRAHGLAERVTPNVILVASGSALLLSLAPLAALWLGAVDESVVGLVARTVCQFLGALLVCLSAGALMLRGGGLRPETALAATFGAVIAWTLGALAAASWSVGFNEADAGAARSWFGDATGLFLLGAVVTGATALTAVVAGVLRIGPRRILLASAIAVPGAVGLGVWAAIPAGMVVGAVAVLATVALQLRASPTSVERVRPVPVPLTTVQRYRLAAVTLVAAVLGVGSVVFALTGSVLVPSVGDSTEAMRVGIFAGTLVAIITVMVAASVLVSRMGRAPLAPSVALTASLLAIAASYALPMDHPLSWPLILLAAVFFGLVGGLILAPILSSTGWFRALLLAAISLALAASLGIMVIYAAFVAPVLAVVAFILLIRRPRRSAVADEPSLDSEGNLARRSAQ